MNTAVEDISDLDVLFDIFNEEDLNEEFMSGSMLENMSGRSTGSLSETESAVDETSSESSGSTDHSRHMSLSLPITQISTGVFASKPLSSYSCGKSESEPSRKRSRTEEKLMRNRVSANKSRLKRKNERIELEQTVAQLRERVQTLEMENNALLTDNTALSQNNYFLQSLIKKQQQEEMYTTETKQPSTIASFSTSQRHMSEVGSVGVLCVIFSVSFFNEWLSSFIQKRESEIDPLIVSPSNTGRVLLGLENDKSDHVSLMHSTHQTPYMLHYVIFFIASLLCYFYINTSVTRRKPSNVLPK